MVAGEGSAGRTGAAVFDEGVAVVDGDAAGGDEVDDVNDVDDVDDRGCVGGNRGTSAGRGAGGGGFLAAVR